jgi:hypothetical protein
LQNLQAVQSDDAEITPSYRRFPHNVTHQEISAQLCMSMNMVMRYSKHIDQERLAREANKKRT